MKRGCINFDTPSIYKLYKIDKKSKTFKMLQNALNNDIGNAPNRELLK